jgi:hypothetical protein
MSEEKEKHSKKNKNEKSDVKGGILVVGGIILFTVLMIVVFVVVPSYITTYFFVDTKDIEGEAEAYDPIAAYDTVSTYAGNNAQLISIEAYYVHSDGTLDLHADYYPRVDYEFYIVVSDEAGNEIPLGAPNSTANAEVLYQAVTISVWDPGQTRSVSTSRSYSYVHLGMEREISEPVRVKPAEPIPAPACSFADLWAIAIAEENAPADAVAIIRYDADGYEFSINDTDVRMQFDTDCSED